ncbi:TPA: AAA family ATPase [Vibrio parahaemolyticus]|uniref:AAA family ATPase n=1 Tax=Vibrio parahaemolyticus TaxID=670 RepID=UPI001E2D1D33|nr:AAA family ATPase [Vibrio parahaemolyticus]
MLTRSINFRKIKSDDALKNILEEKYYFFKDRAEFKGYRYDQDRWENLNEYKELLNKIQQFKSLYIEAFNGLCALCLASIDFQNTNIVFAHPIGSNRDYPRLVKEVKNLMPLCTKCASKYSISYKKKSPTNIESIYDLTQRIPSVVIPHLESTILHVNTNKNSYTYGSNRLNRSIAKFCPSMLDYIKEADSINTILEVYREKTYRILHDKFIFQGHWYSDYEYAQFIFEKHKSHTHQLVKNYKKINNQNNYISFSPVSFNFKNLRELRTGTLDLRDRGYLCILGENGVGKSTLMQSIFTSICSDKNNIFYTENFLYRKNSELNLSFIYSYDYSIMSKFFIQNSGSIYRHQEKNHSKRRFRKDIKVISLDDGRNNYGKHEKELEWLFLQSNYIFSKVAIIIKNFLGVDNATLYRNNGRVFAEFDEKRQDLGKLSSGYKAVICLVISIFRQLEDIKEDKSLASDYKILALIDEVELHLHPKWKTTIIKKLIDNFPQVFFIITTHDPLVLQQCDENCCVKIEKNEKGQSEINPVIDFSDYDVDMMLSSPLFEADYDSSPHERLKQETLRQFLARTIVNESIRKYKKISSDQLAMKLELAVRNEKN